MFKQSNNPLNLLLIFTLECIGLLAYYQLGVFMGSSILGILFVIIAASIWGIFRVNNDPNKAVVEVKGWIRLIIEFVFFTLATVIFVYTGSQTFGLVVGGITILHYIFSVDRISRLLKI